MAEQQVNVSQVNTGSMLISGIVRTLAIMLMRELGPCPLTHLTSCIPSSRAFALPPPTVSPIFPLFLTSSSFLSKARASRARRFLADEGFDPFIVSSSVTFDNSPADVMDSTARRAVGLSAGATTDAISSERSTLLLDSRWSSDS